MASPNGDTLSQDKAVPYVVNFHMVDTDNDGTISADEFKAACGKGLIQGADASTAKSMMQDMKPGGGNMKPGQE
jgi:Ca2+-binding EF-hand superfamily protein